MAHPTARELVAALDREGVRATLTGPADARATHLRALEEADEACLVFYVGDDPAQIGHLRRCVLLCLPGLAVGGEGVARIATEDPRLSFYILARSFAPAGPAPGIHPTAVVHPEASVHPSATVGPHCVLGRCSVGARSVLQSQVAVLDGTRMGADVVAEPHSSIGVTGQIWAWGEDGRRWMMPQVGGTVIEDGCFIGSNVSIVRGALQDTVLGRECRVAHGSRIGHNCRIGAGTFISSGVAVAGSVEIGRHCFLAAGAVVQPGLRLADFVVVGAGTIVNRSFEEERVIVAGAPARALRRIEEGERLPGVPRMPAALFRRPE